MKRSSGELRGHFKQSSPRKIDEQRYLAVYGKIRIVVTTGIPYQSVQTLDRPRITLMWTAALE